MSQDTSFFESSMRRILELERGVAGRSRWDSDIKADSSLSLLCILISGLFSVSVLLNTESSIDVGGRSLQEISGFIRRQSHYHG